MHHPARQNELLFGQPKPKSVISDKIPSRHSILSEYSVKLFLPTGKLPGWPQPPPRCSAMIAMVWVAHWVTLLFSGSCRITKCNVRAGRNPRGYGIVLSLGLPTLRQQSCTSPQLHPANSKAKLKYLLCESPWNLQIPWFLGCIFPRCTHKCGCL